MEIKNLMDLHNAILYLQPNAKFSVWDTNNLKEYHGDNKPIPMFDRLINWHQLNDNKCPTEDEIKNIDQNKFDDHILQKEAKINVEKYKDDLLYKKAFREYRELKPDASFEDFIKYLLSI
jgi:hypothetical protein